MSHQGNAVHEESKKDAKWWKLINWWVVVSIAVVGSAILWIAIRAAGNDVGTVWSSIAVNSGTALVFAAVLVVFEPFFKRSVATAAAERADAAYESRVEELDERVSTLQESTNELFERYSSTEDNAVREMAEHPSFYTIGSALAAANGAHAIDRILGVTVPANTGVPKVVIQFRYVTRTASSRMRHEDALEVSPVALEEAAKQHFPVQQTYVWEPAVAADEMGAKLLKGLEAGGIKSVGVKLNWTRTLKHLEQALTLALESKRADGQLQGHHLIEMGPNGWALTDCGIEYVGKGVVVEAAAFPPEPTVRRLIELQQSQEPKEELPEMPDWADPDEWDFMLNRAQEVFPGLNDPRPAMPPAIASSTPPKKPEPKKPAPPLPRK